MTTTIRYDAACKASPKKQPHKWTFAMLVREWHLMRASTHLLKAANHLKSEGDPRIWNAMRELVSVLEQTGEQP